MIYLIGPMASGKSTVGKSLASALSTSFADSDATIVAHHGTIAQIFAEHGEGHFRDLEVQALCRLRTGVVATGGGAVLREENQQQLSRGTVIYLELGEAAAAERIKGDGHRPLLAGDEALNSWIAVYEKRRAIYEMLADVHVIVDGKSVLQIVEEVLGQLDQL
ncbi:MULTISPECIES: shikimate kinase [Glutamicibacter]|uniref:shikimate kinase n=1 Tax=Glutamicibacter TaxID=1742989 RepID=UPI000EC34A26|nr:shikimate kinase [Glutamicibacter sp.]HCJ54172.1 shikimate kinase [Glutamicibacter sp.]